MLMQVTAHSGRQQRLYVLCCAVMCCAESHRSATIVPLVGSLSISEQHMGSIQCKLIDKGSVVCRLEDTNIIGTSSVEKKMSLQHGCRHLYHDRGRAVPWTRCV